jgi:WD40 repeat protein
MYQKIMFLFVFSLFLLSAGSKVHSQTEVLWSKYFYEANGVKFSADGNVVLVAARDSLLYLFDTYTGEPTKYEKIAFDHDIDYADFNFLDVSKDGKYILGSDFFRCKLWDYENGKLYYNYDLRRQITDIIFHPDCKHVIITYSDYETKNIQLLNIKTNSFVKSADLDGKGDKIAVSEDGRFFAVSEIVGHWSMNLTLWDLQTFTMIKRFPASALYVAINDIAFSPDGKYLAATDENGYIKVWNTETRELVFNKKHEEKNNSRYLQTITFSKNSDYLISSGGFFGNLTTKKWSLPDFELKCTNAHPSGFTVDICIYDTLLLGIKGDYVELFPLCGKILNVNKEASDTLQYPNPVKDIITIELEQELRPPIKIEIFDNSGKLVKNFSLDEIMINNTSITLDMAFLSPGSYFLIINTDGFSKTYSFIKI